MKLFDKKEAKNKIGRPKLADTKLKKKSLIIIGVMLLIIIGLLAGGLVSLNILPKYSKLKGTVNTSLCSEIPARFRPYDAETNPEGLHDYGFTDPKFYSAVLSGSGKSFDDPSYCDSITEEQLSTINIIKAPNSNLNNADGIQYISDNIGDINVANNQLTSIDLSNKWIAGVRLEGNPLEYVNMSNISGYLYGFNSYAVPVTIKKLNLSGTSIAINFNIEGLESIDLSNTKMSSLDLSRFENLKSIDISGNENITSFTYKNGQLENIKLDGASKLSELYLQHNNLEEINLSGLSNLKTIKLSNNNLTALDLSGLKNLNTIEIQNNQLEELKFYNEEEHYSSNITTLKLQNNNLKNINLSSLTKLNFILLHNNNLENIDISNNKQNILITLQENPLSEIKYVLLNKEFDYNSIFKLSPDTLINITDDKIGSYYDGVFKSKKIGTTILQYENSLIITYNDIKTIDPCLSDLDNNIECCGSLKENEFINNYFYQDIIKVYDVTSNEYKIDTDKKIIDVQNKEFNIKNINLHLEELEGIVEGNNYVIKDGDKVVDTYILKNIKKEESVVTTTTTNKTTITTNKTTTKTTVKKTTKKISTSTTKENAKQKNKIENTTNKFKHTTEKIKENKADEKNNKYYLLPIMVILLITLIIFLAHKIYKKTR